VAETLNYFVTETLITALKQITWVEILVFIFSIIYVWLAAYQNNWCWLAAIISVLLYTYVCFTAKLYSEMGLQVFYFIMSFYGWWQWSKHTTQNQKLNISVLKTKKHLILTALGLLLTILLNFIMKTFTDAALTLPDAFVTAFSLIATFMVAKKILENWVWWIVIDSLAIYVHVNRSLYLLAFLYFIYVIIAVIGFINWKKEYSQQKA